MSFAKISKMLIGLGLGIMAGSILWMAVQATPAFSAEKKKLLDVVSAWDSPHLLLGAGFALVDLPQAHEVTWEGDEKGRIVVLRKYWKRQLNCTRIMITTSGVTKKITGCQRDDDTWLIDNKWVAIIRVDKNRGGCKSISGKITIDGTTHISNVQVCPNGKRKWKTVQ